ncbi:MAG: hypothetical protein Kow00107_02460 [Planctomycetota bacterium]
MDNNKSNPYFVARIIVISMILSNLTYVIIGSALTTGMTFSFEKIKPVAEIPNGVVFALIPILFVAAGGVVAAARFAYGGLLKSVKTDSPAETMLKKWNLAVIVQHVLVESAGIMGLVGMLLTGSPWMFALNIAALGAHIAWFPTVYSEEDLRRLFRNISVD